MFKGLHPVFWYGLVSMYVFTFGLMIIEMNSFNFLYQGSGVPLQFYYQTFALVFLNLFLAWLWCYVPEQIEKKKEMGEGVAKSGN